MKGAIPAWLETPPHTSIKPPVTTRAQDLPFGELSWEAFEKLCLRLARLEADAEHCQLYGERGQDQEGIDIYARPKQSEMYRVYQCKREKSFGPAKIKKAVDRFLNDDWADKSDTLVLCTTQSLVSTDRAKALEKEQMRLRPKGITLLPWDSHQLSIKLKTLPEIVDDFFGREWVKAFCGQEEAEKLGRRLDAQGVTEFRQRFATFYRRVFNKHDPGLPLIISAQADSILPLEERYVLPDIDDQRTIIFSHSSENHILSNSEEIRAPAHRRNDFTSADRSTESRHRDIGRTHYTASYRHRYEIENWLSTADRGVILGGPGSGKSALLRFLAIDLLRESPHLSHLAQKWGRHLPIWVPFALWTKMITASPNNEASLKDLLHGWLRSWDEESLWPLVEQALEDKRLLLLVDGLDEWTNEPAAIIALERLQVFIEQRGLPAVVTSRPHGFSRLGLQVAGWQIGKLSDFSIEQQKKLARIWFTYRIRATSSGTAEIIDDSERRIESETGEFIAELSASSDLQELAKVPLLLTLLIAHRSYNVRLPQSRFKAYDSLIEHLLLTHPRRRRTAASLTSPLSELAEEDIRRVLSHLAYHMQNRFSEGVIEQNEATTIIESFLRGKEGSFFDFESFEARKYSKEVMEVAEHTAGLLVRRSPKEIGFFHRAFQEYLAALYISGMPLAEQLVIVSERCVDPQWREVTLALFHMTTRQEDTKQFIDQIRTKNISAVESYTVESLLSETAFGDFNCSVRLARELARETFRSIEFGDWMSHRELLLRHALEGLRSSKVKEIVKAQLKKWFPRRAWWQQERLFKAMAKWQSSLEVVDCLYRGIHDEEIASQRQAARSLADVAAGDTTISELMAQLASYAIDPLVRAAALEGFMRGWPKHERLPEIIDAARKSINPELRLIGIIGRIQLNIQNEEDLKELFYLGYGVADLNYHWDDEVATALITGWPRSPSVKEECFKALRAGRYDANNLDHKLAGRILLEGFSQDDEVASYCVEEIEKHRKGEFSLFLSSDYDNWERLAKHFRGHPLLVAAVDEWLLDPRLYRDIETRYAVLIGRTEVAKAKLFSYLDSKNNTNWVVEKLLEGWGMEDEEVARRLKRIAYGPPAEVAKIANLLPRIIEDKAECRNRLLALLQNQEKDVSTYRVLEGLEILGELHVGTGTASIIIDHVLQQPPADYGHGFDFPRVITNFPSDPRVRELAKQELLNPEGSYWPVASAYGGDDEIRRMIIDMVNPIPVTLRKLIATHLGEGVADEEFALSLLELYELDRDDEVLSQGSISYHTRLRAAGRDLERAINKLAGDLGRSGPDYVKRRQAALAGLLTLDRLDVLVKKKEISPVPGEGSRHVPISNGLTPNVPLLKTVLQNWGSIKETLGINMQAQLARFPSESNSMSFWEEICLFADEYPAVSEDAFAFLENQRTRRPNILSFIARARPKGRLLLENCLHTLKGPGPRNIYEFGEASVAAELLGIHFGGDQDVLNRLIAEHPTQIVDKNTFDEALIIALCEGWPESNELERIFEAAREHNPSLSYPAYFQIICRKSGGERILEALLDTLEDFEDNSLIRSLEVSRPIIRRLQADDDLLNLFIEHINNDPSPSEKATISRLIASARGVSPELRKWCVEQAEKQLTNQIYPEVGLDIVSRNLRPVAHSMMDVLKLG